MVESLQSQVKQLQETIRLRKHKKTSSVRKKSTSNKGIKTKKKTKRRPRSRKNEIINSSSPCRNSFVVVGILH
jgi:hypothetical protein